MSEYLITGVSVLGEQVQDLHLVDGVIAHVGSGHTASHDATHIDAAGWVALPGLVDLHTHLREPGGEEAETVLSASHAAAAGGYTAVCAMPNTNPVADSALITHKVAELGREIGVVDVYPIGAVTLGQRGETLAPLAQMHTSGVQMFSDDGQCVADPVMMRRALGEAAALGVVIAQHAEDARMTAGAQMSEGKTASTLGFVGWPQVAEETIIARDVVLAAATGGFLHVCHVSSARSVEVIRWAKQQGWPVTAEVTPHHLLLTDEKVESFDPVFKVNPPLRSAADVHAVRRGLAEGVIDVVATDHAPHTEENKQCNAWDQAKPGMLGLETAVGVVAEAMVGTGLLTWGQVAERMSVTPARIAQLAEHGGRLQQGSAATLTLINPDDAWQVRSTELHSRSTNTPFAGLQLPARVQETFLRGVRSFSRHQAE